MSDFAEANHNKDFTLIARDCVGGVLYHQLGLRFLTPTINLFFTPEDFNALCLNLKEYLEAELVEASGEDKPYPVGALIPKGLNAIKVHFMHYETFVEAKSKWDERKTRVHWDNIFVLSTVCYVPEASAVTPELIQRWNQIPYRKAILVDRPYGFDDEHVIAKPAACEEFAWLLFTPNPEEPWRRTFNDFDFLRFLNP